MSRLEKYIVTGDYDIMTFNQYVAAQRSTFITRGETLNDLLVNLFKSYLLVPDVKFTKYIQKKKDDYDDGDYKVAENSLMAEGCLKHKIVVKERKYNVPTKEEQKIIVLSAEFDDLKNKNAELTAQLKEKTPKEQETQGRRGRWREIGLEEIPTCIRRIKH